MLNSPRPLHRYWQDLTSTELDATLGANSVAVLPLAAIEQHGAHLPLSTDLDIGEGLVAAAIAALPEDFPLLVLPPMAVGSSHEHASYTGTLSLPPETAMASIVAHGDSVARAGVRRLLLFSSHGGNKAVADIAALELRRRWGMLVAKAAYFRFAPPARTLPADELRHGLHGGALETAMMLHLAPHKVRREHLGQFPSSGEAMAKCGWTLAPEGEAAFAWLAEDLHPGGVVGDARLADAALGERLVAHYGATLARIMIEASRMDIGGFQPQPEST